MIGGRKVSKSSVVFDWGAFDCVFWAVLTMRFYLLDICQWGAFVRLKHVKSCNSFDYG